ncbi:autotransporter domain-containing protein [Fusobacterium ulcerans]|uniref:autotransporter domain-containing protein n=1 Tax=Fusobacterium ulcerans TaxID=861 RepID=UPI003FEEAE41
MMEKIMKAVKSGNKKRGRNITVGAVVGMLLSCTVVMGADVSGLDITKDGGEIKFSKDGSPFDPNNTNNPYPENIWDEESKIYTNNSGIFVENNSGNAYGLKLSGNLNGVSFINKGTIAGTTKNGDGSGIYIASSGSIGTLTNNGSIVVTSSGDGYGIHNDGTITELENNGSITGTASGSYGSGIYNSNASTIKTLTNNGTITGTSSGSYGNGYGIYLINEYETVMAALTNNGIITGTSSGSSGNGSGIYIRDNSITKLENNGTIIGTSSESSGMYSSGIYNAVSGNQGPIETLTNNGTIIGTNVENESYGIYNGGRYIIETLTNTGVIYGKTNAIKDDYATISNAYNYGLLVSGKSGDDTVSNVTALTDSNNLGLIFKEVDGKYTATGDGFKKFGTISGDDEYTIINAKVDGIAKDNITGTKNLVLKDGTLFHEDSDTSGIKDYSSDKNYILNGITDTLLVKGKNNKVNNSIINAYKTAVVMNGESSLILENTTVNGGVDGTVDDNGNLKGYSPAILVKGNNNFLTISGDSIVNGDMKADGEKNTLNLYGKQNMTRSSDNKSMNILHDIEGFGRIQIENNVTFFEDVKVTGVERLNINKGGTLSLRLKKAGDKATHALTGNDGLLIAGKEEEGSENAGTLNFITNGMGTNAVIDMGGIKLENVYLRANSILYNLEVIKAPTDPAENEGDIKLGVSGGLDDVYNKKDITPDEYPKDSSSTIPDIVNYNSLNKIYKSSVAVDDNVDAVTDMIGSASDEEQWEKLLTFLGGIYTESPYSYSSELSRRSVGMFRDIITENEFRPNLNNWLIMGGLTHADGGTKDTYYGQNYYEIDNGSSSTNADMKLTGAYMLAKYGYSENTSLGLTLGGNKSEAEMSMSKIKGNSGYIGAFAENYRGNLTLKAGAGVQYSEYDADRRTIGGHSYSDKYSDMTYDIYLNGRYSHNIGKDLFLEPYATLSYTYVDQDGANEGSKALAIKTDSKSFDYTVAKAGVDLKKVIPHEKGKSTVSVGVSYTKILDGADEEHITGRFKGGSDFDILVAHKNEHSIGLNAKYALELENGVLFDVKGTYSVERDSHNQSGKNRTKGEWIVGVGIGYKF